MSDQDQRYHELSNHFPLMRGEEFDKLVEDIRENGLLQPIVRYEGKILDGRNRWRACKKAGVEPEFVDYEGSSPAQLVVSMNARRRHLEPAQVALCVRELKTDLQEEVRREEEARGIKRDRETGGFEEGTSPDPAPPPDDARSGSWTERAGEEAGISGHTVRRVDRVAQEAEDPDSPHREEAEELLEQIKSGEIGAKTAERRLRELKQKEKEKEKPERERRAEAARAKLAEAERYGDKFRAALQDLVQEGHTDHLGPGDAAKIGSILQQIEDSARRLYEVEDGRLLGRDPPEGRVIELEG